MKLATRTEKVNVEALAGYPGNARRGNLDVVRESLRAHGQYKPIVVQESTGYILAGNHTWQAAKAEGWTEILATFVDVDDDAARKINLVDNRSNDLATYDFVALDELLAELGGDLDGTGFTQEDHDALKAQLGPGGWKSKDKDAAPKPPAPEDAVTKLGDVIELGPHRLVCGSSLDPAVVALATKGQPVDLVVTDPPYLVDYGRAESTTEVYARRLRRDGKTVTGDDLTGAEADQFAVDAMLAVHAALKPGGVFYVFSPPGIDELRFRLALGAAGLELRQVLLWVKDTFVFGRQDYQWRHESMLYGWKDGAGHFYCGDATQDTIWECDRPKRSKDHPTMKPVALLERAVANSSRDGELVLDLFGGSGSTLVAAAALGRRCGIVELDPCYCDVIVARWEKLTGETVR